LLRGNMRVKAVLLGGVGSVEYSGQSPNTLYISIHSGGKYFRLRIDIAIEPIVN
jgi:hypothetical protein